VEHEREWPLEVVVAELRSDVRHLAADLAGLRQDVRRLEGRLFQLLVAQIATLATALASLIVVLAG
jgi:hypothetical protein